MRQMVNGRDCAHADIFEVMGYCAISKRVNDLLTPRDVITPFGTRSACSAHYRYGQRAYYFVDVLDRHPYRLSLLRCWNEWVLVTGLYWDRSTSFVQTPGYRRHWVTAAP